MRVLRENLLLQFSIASFLILAGIAWGLTSILSQRAQIIALEQLESEAIDSVGLHLLNHLTPEELSEPMTGETYATFHSYIRENILSSRTARIKIWGTDGTVIYSDDSRVVGQRFPDHPNLLIALGGGTALQVEDPAESENEFESDFGTLMEVYTPILYPGDEHPSGVLEVYQYYQPVKDQIREQQKWIYGTSGIGFALLYISLVGFVWRGWRTINRQKTDLARTNTELVKSNLALNETEHFTRTIIASVDEGVIVYDRELRYRQWNAFMENLSGMAEDEVRGKYALDIFPHLKENGIDRLLHRALDGESVTSQDYLYTPAGSESSVWLSGTFSPHTSSTGEIIGVVGIIHDITARKTAEQEVQQRVQRLSALHQVDQAIVSSLDLQIVLSVLVREISQTLNIDACDLLLLDSETNTLHCAARLGFRTDALRHTHLPLGKGLAGKAAQEQRIIKIPQLPDAADALKDAHLLPAEGFVSYYATPLIAKGKVKGVLEIFHRDYLEVDSDWLEFLETLAWQAAVAIDNAELFDNLQRSNQELVLAYDTTLEGWAHFLELRDAETKGHTQRVTELTLKLAAALGIEDDELVHMRRGALLHDIGKMGVPDKILLKPGPLEPEEWAIMKMHPLYAYDMLSPIDFLRPALDIPLYHHEKWDGHGYPMGLQGADIPLAARIFALTDVWDALLSDRPYRKAWSVDEARSYLVEQTGKHFDPQLVEPFLDIIDGSRGRARVPLGDRSAAASAGD